MSTCDERTNLDAKLVVVIGDRMSENAWCCNNEPEAASLLIWLRQNGLQVWLMSQNEHNVAITKA